MKSLAWAIALTFALSAASAAQQTAPTPADSGLVEQTERRLMQIDVTVRGPAETVAALTAEDFKLAVGREDIEKFVLDRVCIEGGFEGLDLADPEVAASAPRLRTLLFFDQTHLTMAGRRRSIELARELIPELLSSGRSEAMIVSASHRLEVSADWSSDPAVLLAALDDLEDNPEQISTWADQEDTRVDRLMSAIERMAEFTQEATREYNRNERELEQMATRGGSGFGQMADSSFLAMEQRRRDNEKTAAGAQESARTMARIAARDLYREEAARTSGGLSLFNIALSRLNNHAPPKAVVYFADTMRANAGDFYIAMLKSADRAGSLSMDFDGVSDGPVVLSYGNYLTEFQEAIDLATENSVRFYTVQGRGLVHQTVSRSRFSSGSISTASPLLGRARFKDAESALAGFAGETGGKSFLWAANADDIAHQILDDLSCLFVFSFHALDLQEDRRTPLWINVEKPGIELKYRPSMIARSDKKRERDRLAGAFWIEDRRTNGARVQAVPTGFKAGKYTVLVQFAMPGSNLAASDWDMGLTAIVGQSKTIEAAGRVALNQPGLPLVFEAEMRFRPGDYTITAVAENNAEGTLISTRAEGSLPDPDDGEPFVASIAMLQRTPGAFVRGEASKTAGSLAHGPAHWLRPDRATGILALVCGNKRAGSVTVGRSLVGASEVSFDPVEVEFGAERCALLVDTIDGDVLTSGKFSYAVALDRAAASVADASRDFLVVSENEIVPATRD